MGRKIGGLIALLVVVASVLSVGASADQGRRLAGPFCIGKASLKNLEGTLAGYVKPGKATQRAGILRAGAVRSVAKNQPCRPWEVRREGLALPKVPGPPGPAGANGANGRDGANGSNGGTGATGATGSTGAAGATGATGPQGPKGDKGDRGERGPRGEGCRRDDNHRDLSGLKGDSPRGDDRDGIDCRGPKGDRGPAGPPGPPGKDGKDGLPGKDGKDGRDGGLGDKVKTLCVSEGNNVKWGGDNGELCDPGHDFVVKIVVVG